MRTSNRLSRRALLRGAAGTSATAMCGRLGLMSSALAAGNASAAGDYKALVCVFLYGGSDSANLYVPSSSSGYARYASARRLLQVPLEALLTTGTDLGFNPHLPRTHALFETGSLAIVRNVGNLGAPLSRAEYLAESPMVPVGLFAHDYQQEQWQKGYSSRPSALTDSGWGGRVADRLVAAGERSAISPNISVSVNNFWIPGDDVASVSVHPVRGLDQLRHFDAATQASNSAREATLAALFAATGAQPMKQQIISDFERAKAASRTVTSALADSATFETPFDAGNTLATQLRMVARLVAAREALGARRQVFFVGAGDWDTHGGQAARLPLLMETLDDAFGSFHETLLEMDMLDQVTTFTASDFGRSLTTNGDGTDHGWGGHYMVMGGAVNGGALYGHMPDYSLGSVDDAGEDGRFIPTTSVNQYGAVMARWLGLDDTDLARVFPDLGSFGNAWDADLQFMS